MPRKHYQGPVMSTLLALAEAELGPGAVIHRVTHGHDQHGRPTVLVEAGDASTAPATPMRPEPAGAPRVTIPLDGPIVLAFVGPTGAGKTTTIAKLASHPDVFAGRTVGLLGLDTFRVGAAEQLGWHAWLGQCRVEMVHAAADLPRARRRLDGCDVILVDCPGRGPRQRQDARVVQSLLTSLAPHEVHLVLPAGMHPARLRQLMAHHRADGVTHLLASKMDEFPDDWSVFELAAERQLPMRWLTDGQGIPGDLRPAAARLEASQARARGVAYTAAMGVA